MRVLGLAVQVGGKRALVHAVVLDDKAAPADPFDVSAASVADEFDVPVDEDDLAVQLGGAAETIAGRVRSLRLDRVVVRRADRPIKPSNMEGPRTRLLIEGAVTSAAQRVVPDTVLRAGKECGASYGVSKDELDALAKPVAKPARKEASAAALSGLAEGRMHV